MQFAISIYKNKVSLKNPELIALTTFIVSFSPVFTAVIDRVCRLHGQPYVFTRRNGPRDSYLARDKRRRSHVRDFRWPAARNFRRLARLNDVLDDR